MHDDAQWYKDAIIYELHVRSFCDSDGDGIGDFKGLIEKLDYLRELGVTALWLLPFYPSPLRDDGYDIADYTRINPIYGSLRDFKVFLREAHRRGLRVIGELVINHTSDKHPWFQRARRAPAGSAARDFYVWSDTPDRYAGTRVIFKDFEPSNWTFDSVANAYFWHRFYHHQPDLNFDNPEVHKALFEVLDFWLELGLDGLRLDAVPYLYEREGTSCENLPETHEFLRKLRRHIDEKFTGRMLLAEANQWPEDAAAYFGAGDECHMNFHFPAMPRLFMAIRMEDRSPIIDILEQTPVIPDTCQWALFLRNHDELTLEMVTEEDRDYMVRVYANDPQARINLGIRRRLAPLLGNHRRRIELMNGLLFSLPGTPVIYYADEIGMGDNIYLGDRNGVRTPMQWSGDRNAGFSRANPQRLFLPVVIDPEYHYEAINVEAQQQNPSSLLWWMRRLIALRKRFRAFSRGTIRFLDPANHRILAFLREFDGETILVVANLSRFVQFCELDLATHAGAVPVELFGQTRFPALGTAPFFLTLGPHGFYWFSLESSAVEPSREVPARVAAVPEIRVSESWESLFGRSSRPVLEAVLTEYVKRSEWFESRPRTFGSGRIVESVAIPTSRGTVHLVLMRLSFTHDDHESVLLPLGFRSSSDGEANGIEQATRIAVVRVLSGDRIADGVLFDATGDPALSSAVLSAMRGRASFRGSAGRVIARPTRALRDRTETDSPHAEASSRTDVAGSASSVDAGRWSLKLYRFVEPLPNPDLELGRFLTQRTSFAHSRAVGGTLEFKLGRAERMSLGILQADVPHEGDALQFTLGFLERFFDQVRSRGLGQPELPVDGGRPLDLLGATAPAVVEELLGTYLGSVARLGQRTAELHLALCSDREDLDFAPEPVPTQYQRSMYQSVRSLSSKVFRQLRQKLVELPPSIQWAAHRALTLEQPLLRRLNRFLERPVSVLRIRCHGDFNLGQVLVANSDFIFQNFQGEPGRSIGERRLKRSALRDVASLLRSLQYAVHLSLRSLAGRGEDVQSLDSWGQLWELWSSASFLRGYLRRAGQAVFLPGTLEETAALLEVHLLEKALYELRLEMSQRPEWLAIPVLGITRLVEPAQ